MGNRSGRFFRRLGDGEWGLSIRTARIAAFRLWSGKRSECSRAAAGNAASNMFPVRLGIRKEGTDTAADTKRDDCAPAFASADARCFEPRWSARRTLFFRSPPGPCQNEDTGYSQQRPDRANSVS